MARRSSARTGALVIDDARSASAQAGIDCQSSVVVSIDSTTGTERIVAFIVSATDCVCK